MGVRQALAGGQSLLHFAGARMHQAPLLWILTYHRVLPDCDPRYGLEEPGMVVTPQRFERHMRFLKEHFTTVDLEDWLEQARHSQGVRLPRRCACVTFDDGWLDNHQFALPVLRRLGIRATIFVCTGLVGTQRRFWPNRLATVLQELGPEHRSLNWLRDLADGRVTSSDPRRRLSEYVAVCKSLDEAEVIERIAAAERAAAITTAKPELLSWELLRSMADSGLVRVGSHTVNHTRLVEGLPPEIVRAELEESYETISKEIGSPPNLFCYPNGDVSQDAQRLVRDLYRGAVTTQSGINRATADPYLLRRINIHDGNGRSALRLFTTLYRRAA